MAEDVTEKNNLADEYDDVVKRLIKHHDKCTGECMQQ